MDPGDPDEPSREELESRVEQLEETVSKMLPDRRGVLKGLGAAAIGGAAVGGATGGASGQSAAGQVGTESEPVDVEAADVAAQSVSTTEAQIGSRNIATTSDKTVTVSNDSELSEALDNIELLVQNDYSISLESGSYTDNHEIPYYLLNDIEDGEDVGSTLVITGDTTNPSNVSVNSLLVNGAGGKRPLIVRGIEFTGGHPVGDTAPSFQINSGVVIIRNCEFSNSTGEAGRAIVSYGGSVITKDTIDYGTDVYDQAVVVKNVGSYDEQGSITGSVARGYNIQSADYISIRDNNNLAVTNERFVGGAVPIPIGDSDAGSMSQLQNVAQGLAGAGEFRYETSFDSLDGFGDTLNGSASATVSSGYLELDTGGTSGSLARVYKTPTRTYTETDFAYPWTLALGVGVLDGWANRVDYYTVGEIDQGASGFGFKVSGGDLLGVTDDGSTEETTTLISSPSNFEQSLKAIYRPNDRVRFYLGDKAQPAADITTTLPSGTADRVVDLSVENTTTTAKRLQTGDVRVARSGTF